MRRVLSPLRGLTSPLRSYPGVRRCAASPGLSSTVLSGLLFGIQRLDWVGFQLSQWRIHCQVASWVWGEGGGGGSCAAGKVTGLLR